MKAVLSYMVVFISAFFYMLLFDRSAGWIMIVFLTAVPAISVFLTLFTRKKLDFSIVLNDTRIKKNQKHSIRIAVKKNIFLPVPIVSFSLSLGDCFKKPEFDIYRFSMSENKHIDIDIDVFPEVFGSSEITISNISVTDYLGIFRFRTKTKCVSEKIYILPEIKELDDASEIFHSIYASLPDNDDDDTTALVYGRATYPGYEYREYVPGDSLKKINWKLSSKRNQLYVRIDESSGITLPDIILDTTPVQKMKDNRKALRMQEMITEGALSLLMMCVNNGIECTFSYTDNGVNHKKNISSPSDVEAVAFDLCLMKFGASDIVLCSDDSSKSTDISIVYTLDYSEKLAYKAEDYMLRGNNIKIIMPEELCMESSVNFEDLWMIGEELVPVRVI